MDERISAPVTSSVIPKVCNSSRWPSAVPPPWLPMAGIRNGIALNFFEVIYYSLDDDRIICDRAAPTGNSYGIAGFNFALQLEFRELDVHCFWYLRKRRVVKLLCQ